MSYMFLKFENDLLSLHNIAAPSVSTGLLNSITTTLPPVLLNTAILDRIDDSRPMVPAISSIEQNLEFDDTFTLYILKKGL